jgi:hypothetical protein
VDAQELGKMQEEERKQNSREKVRAITEEIDFNREKANLLKQIAGHDEALAMALEEDQERQKAKLEQRRALLLARRRNKNKQAIEEQRVKDKIDIIEQEEKQKQ